ncbi:unnamed protein product [Prorocentrum cordatum]|uniref:4Fe-4S ferredoxin-type domain-containing protein n=1 Tax=Prorocentrum cordatum TaxID=2364126 RepID=A0ABN9PSG1_9DINO|nr:unnamed protein product [Polarella glacialis]
MRISPRVGILCASQNHVQHVHWARGGGSVKAWRLHAILLLVESVELPSARRWKAPRSCCDSGKLHSAGTSPAGIGCGECARSGCDASCMKVRARCPGPRIVAAECELRGRGPDKLIHRTVRTSRSGP